MKAFRRPSISFRSAAWMTGIFAALYFVMMMLVQDEYPRLVVSNIFFPLQKLIAVAALFFAARLTAQRQPGQARSWYLWAFGMTAYAIGDILWSVLQLGFNRDPFPSIADPFYLLYCPLIWLGLFLYPTDEFPIHERRFTHLDNLIVVIGSGLCMWTLLIAPALSSHELDLWGYILGALYPILGVLLLWGVLIFFRNRIGQSVHLPVLFLGIGTLGEIISDTLFAISPETYTSNGSWIDLGWVLGSWFFTLAALQQVQSLMKSKGKQPVVWVDRWLRRLSTWPIYLPYVWVVIAYLILVVSLPINSSNLYLVAGIGTIIALVIFRQILTITENERLFRKAQQELLERKQAQDALYQANLVLDQRVQERTQDLQNSNQQLSETNTILEMEIVERKQAEELLQNQVKIEELIASISASFINLPVEKIDKEIERSLKRIGKFIGADRSYLFQLSDNKDWLSNTYEWRQPGVKAQKAALQAIPVAGLPPWMSALRRREVIQLPRVAEMPPTAFAEIRYLIVPGVQSVVVTPLVWDRSLVGFLGFSAVRQAREWKSEEITLIKIAGEILLTALQRKAAQEALSRYAQRLKMLHEIDQAVLAEQTSDQIVADALKNMFALSSSRGGALVTVNREEGHAKIFLASEDQGVHTFSLDKTRDPAAYDEICGAIEGLSSEHMLHAHQIPAILFRNLFPTKRLGMEDACLLAAPLRQQGQTTGFLCFRSRSRDDMSLDEMEMIREVVPSLAVALQQAQLRQELQKRLTWMEASLQEKEVLIKEIHHRVKNNLQVISSLLNLQTQLVQYPEAVSALRDSQMRVRLMALIHEKLYQSDNLSQIDLEPFIKSLSMNLFQSFQQTSGKVNLVTQVQKMAVGVDQAVPMGLILNELISNSLKHAFPDGRRGEIGIEIKRETEENIQLCYYDNGIGLPAGWDIQSGKSLGMRLVLSLVRQLEGEMEVIHHTGTKFRILIPMIAEGAQMRPEPV